MPPRRIELWVKLVSVKFWMHSFLKITRAVILGPQR